MKAFWVLFVLVFGGLLIGCDAGAAPTQTERENNVKSPVGFWTSGGNELVIDGGGTYKMSGSTTDEGEWSETTPGTLSFKSPTGEKIATFVRKDLELTVTFSGQAPVTYTQQ